MGWFTSRATKEKRSHFKNMLTLARLDGDLDENEQEFLIKRGLSGGLTKKDINLVLDSPEKVEFCPPKDPDKCVAQLHDLIIMMLADGVLEPKEMDFCQSLAKRMGFRGGDVPKMLGEMIDQARKNRKPGIESS